MTLETYSKQVAKLINLGRLEMSEEEVDAEIEAALEAGKSPRKCAEALKEYLDTDTADRFMTSHHE
jgi:hypothetical protein